MTEGYLKEIFVNKSDEKFSNDKNGCRSSYLKTVIRQNISDFFI